jgi:hypothetical protein
LADGTIVRKPDDWSTYPSGNFGGLPPTLRSYTDGKLNEVQEGIQSYIKLRDYSVDASGNRSGETRIEFLRTNPNESFGSNECSDWMIGANSLCGFDIYRKATHPSLGVLYNGTVLEFDQDGDINCVKVGGLKVNGNEVATKSYTDTTFATIGVEQSVSDLSTASSSHGQRLAVIENAGYATTSQLSTYATASSLGDTNTTVGGINNRVNTLETSGFVTSAGLGGYNFATQGYVQDALPDVSDFVTSSTLSTNHYTKIETDTAIPTTTDILNNTNVGATATSGATAGVTVTNKSSGSDVDFTFTIPPGEQGIQGEQDEAGSSGLDANGVLSISKNGEVAKFQPAMNGSHTLVNFNSKVNSGSDRGFILVLDETANSPGSSTEDLRVTVGVYNDFLQSTAHSDELWLQGGGRLCYNVGSWDSELNSIIGTPGAGSSHGGVKHEWRINNSAKMTLNSSGDLGTMRLASLVG